MFLRLAFAAFATAAAWPAAAQIQKCQGPRGVTYADGACPPGAAPAGGVAAATPRSGAGGIGAQVADAPVEAVDTGIPAIVQLAGKFAWLDDDTLAVTTFADPHAKVPWMVRKIVAWDVPTRATSTLVPRGFIDCANAEFNLLGLQVGDLESRFAVGSRAPLPVQQFELWDAATRQLAPAPAQYKASWHPAACLKPAPEDLAVGDLLGSRKPVRYLQPEHGTLEWGNLDAAGHPEGPSLHTPRRKIMLAGLGMNEVSHDVRYLPFRHAYQIAAGLHDRAANPPRDLPLLTMDVDGHLARHAIPPALVHALDGAGAGAPASMQAVKGGDLIVQAGTPATGGGFYLVQGEQSRRVWCTATPAPGQAAGADACTLSQAIAVSPSGCRIAFDAKPATPLPAPFGDAPTIKVMELCAASMPTRLARKR